MPRSALKAIQTEQAPTVARLKGWEGELATLKMERFKLQVNHSSEGLQLESFR